MIASIKIVALPYTLTSKYTEQLMIASIKIVALYINTAHGDAGHTVKEILHPLASMELCTRLTSK